MATDCQELSCPRASGNLMRRDEDSLQIIEVGDFTIDVRNRAVLVQGRELLLDQAELDLLIFLTANRRKVVTPRTLLITRWAKQRTRQEDFLPILLSLRKKLEEEIPGQHYVRIEPWVLCRFEPNV